MKIKNADTPPPLDPDEAEKLKGRRRFWALIIIILLLLLFFLIFQWKISQTRAAREAEARQQQFALAIEKAQEKAKFILDSIKAADSVGEVSPSFQNRPDSSRAGLSVVGAGLKPAPVTVKPAPTPTNTTGGISTTPSPKGGTPLTTPAQKSAPTDTLPPTPSILPPAGRYYKPINLRVECGEQKCIGDITTDTNGQIAQSIIENYNRTGTVFFRATDSAGNTSPWQPSAYNMASDNNCAPNSFPVSVKEKIVCVDAYEFPNIAGEKPRNMVSQNSAAMLCESTGKHLCSIDEWQAACKGDKNQKYPYGNAYNQTKCATDLRTAKEPLRSGFSEHCRSWFGMYDMSGNLWEWTSSPARDGLFLVAGGAWNTQNASSCTETKFSFYPQNEYPFVGFRCCK